MVVELENIAFSYGERRLLHGVSLAVGDRDFIGVTGANGCGKTTLLKIILGLLQPHAGRVKYATGARSAIGYLPQYNNIDRMFPISVRQVVELGLLDKKSICRHRLNAAERKAVDEALVRMAVDSFADKPIGSLSGGELQRTLLARAIVSRPRLLILDEPNTYLDASSEEELYRLLADINRDCAIILVGHDVDNVKKICKRVVRVDGTLHAV